MKYTTDIANDRLSDGDQIYGGKNDQDTLLRTTVVTTLQDINYLIYITRSIRVQSHVS